VLARPHWLLAGAALGALVLAAGGPAKTIPPCYGSQLRGTFSVINGSAGAGSISYVLRLQNRSAKTCFVSGLPTLRLVGRTGKQLPTKVIAAFRPGLTAARVVLRPGARAKTEARFSPDIPGPGEPQRSQCEPKAYRVRVTVSPGGGTLVGPVLPPTPVCEHGTMSVRALSAA
jgi:Protein of unknown function (DUF4232)